MQSRLSLATILQWSKPIWADSDRLQHLTILKQLLLKAFMQKQHLLYQSFSPEMQSDRVQLGQRVTNRLQYP